MVSQARGTLEASSACYPAQLRVGWLDDKGFNNKIDGRVSRHRSWAWACGALNFTLLHLLHFPFLSLLLLSRLLVCWRR